jgi:single-strand DNA-binding protein
VNKAILIGRLGQDPKTANTQTGTVIVNLSLATDESFTGQDGNKVERTEWHRVVAFGKQAEFCSNYLSKGRLVLVEGSHSDQEVAGPGRPGQVHH